VSNLYSYHRGSPDMRTCEWRGGGLGGWLSGRGGGGRGGGLVKGLLKFVQGLVKNK